MEPSSRCSALTTTCGVCPGRKPSSVPPRLPPGARRGDRRPPGGAVGRPVGGRPSAGRGGRRLARSTSSADFRAVWGGSGRRGVRGARAGRWQARPDRIPLHGVDPGEVRNGSGDPVPRVHAASRGRGSPTAGPTPVPVPTDLPWATGLATDDLPTVPDSLASLPPAGEDAAHAAAERFFVEHLADYDECARPPRAGCDRRAVAVPQVGLPPPPAAPAPTRATTPPERRFRDGARLAGVLRRRAPRTGRTPAGGGRSRRPPHACGSTPAPKPTGASGLGRGAYGLPVRRCGHAAAVGEAWMHNRVRMVVASFLVKDLHLDCDKGRV